MKTSTVNFILGSALLAGGACLMKSACQQMQRENVKVREDIDVWEGDKRESVDADKVPEEKGLTQLDSAHRNDWVANGFPQTHRAQSELAEDAKWSDSTNKY
ncbi:hypothetical protein M3202_15850 [Alkalihalobacillus oceani]|uniref:Lipoprotein n=1 Tax=Halalkalibacter oceani TaxID=1653776 RepID=A0A9X2DRC8_9BACI|nr:hypothetical protein [Halalkalibacter oceani]MCM3715544.1 hypothetical protein [Halalkalibacter oceani]